MSNELTQKEKINQLSPLQRAALALKKLETKLNNTFHEPIAIIGIGCHFPGGSSDPERFWQFLKKGISARTEIPPERWDIEAYYNPDPAAPGKMITRYGHFVEQVDQFDPGFFGISPREAVAMDPQHRLLLEVSWQALERAAQMPERLSEASVGVFVGNDGHDYEHLLQQGMQHEPESPLVPYAGTGIHISTAAGRLAYSFGFIGPTMTIDTACSSSLVAIHQACNSLRLGECQMALAGGVKLHLFPTPYVLTSKTRMISADGMCKTFDASADGYGRGEGCGMVVLKRLSDAQRNGDSILALIRGSAVNQDGPSSGLTVPNGRSQQRLIRQALGQAQVKPSEISYLEAHGTGTSLGDPIEVNAAAAVLGEARSSEQPLWIGAVKTNIGHLEAASGVSGLIKVVLSLQHQQIPAHLHLQEPNPNIDWQPWLQVPQELTPWEVSGRRLAGVSSFGFTGTNAHLVIEEALPRPESPQVEWERPVHILKLSAKTETALTQLAQSYSQHLEMHPEQALADVCFTANTGRLSYNHRLSLVARTKAELQEQLGAFGAGQEVSGLVSGVLSGANLPKVAFLFTGQGSQYVGMGRQLYETQPTFRKTLHQCAEILQPYLDRPLLDVIFSAVAEDSPIEQTAYTQPALFALEYALYQLWQSWGIQPSAVMGHSVGEYVAACVAGVFSLEDGLKLIATRGKLMQQLPIGGAMVSLMASETQVGATISNRTEVAIAAINGPESTVISGAVEAVQSVVAQLEAAGITSKPLHVSHAFHSTLMQPILAEFEQVARQVNYSAPRVKLISNVTGSVATAEVATPEYWCRHILSPVNFAAGMQALHQQGFDVFLECGPKPILLGMGRQCLPEGIGAWLPSLRPGQEDWQALLTSLSELYVRGVKIDWEGFDHDYPQRRKVTLPTYPFQRQRYWVDSAPKPHQVERQGASSEVLTLLQEGNTQALLQQLQHCKSFSETLSPSQVLEHLAQLHQRQVAQSSMSDLLFHLDWQAQPSLSEVSLPPGQWLLLADQSGLASALVNLLQSQGHQSHWLPSDSSAETLERLESLLTQLAQDSILPFHGVIYLGDWSSSRDDFPHDWDWEAGWRQSTHSLLHLVQAMGQLSGVFPKLWIVTRQAQAVDSSLVAADQASLWGLGRVIALEHPELWGGLIDLEAAQELLQSAKQVLTEILQGKEAVQVAYRQGDRYLPRLVRLKEVAPEMQLSSESSYLISGGLGALGLQVAQRLVEQGVRHLVLLGRRGITNEVQQQAIVRLKTAGAQVQIVIVDVGNWTELGQAWTELQSSMPPVRGVIHAAGVLDDGLLQDQSWERFVKVMSPKVQGGWNLHRLTQDSELDFFVCFSSVAAMLGSVAQSNYAAANAFLDGLCEYRNSLGLPGVSLNWGPWSEVGMAADLSQALQTRLAQIGLKFIQPEQGLQVLEQQLGARGQLGVMAFDWDVFRRRLSARETEFFAAVLPPEAPERMKSSQQQQLAADLQQRLTADFQQRLATADEAERIDILRQTLQEEVARLLGLPAAEKTNPQTGFFELGMDSLMAMELRTRLTQLLCMDLPSTLIFDFPNIEKLEQYLNTQFIETTQYIQPSQASKLINVLKDLEEVEF